jgi:pimeloyl-ACP methyl ester carboxylesterase
VAVAVLAAGCSAGAPGIVKPAPAPSTMAGYYAQRLDWRPCDNGFQCARLAVPFDYGRPGWRRFSLPVIKLPASGPSRRVGALVVNPGGPGVSGVQYALSARSQFPAALRARFDIVGFDPRGVGGSEPALRCMTGPQLDKYFATDDSPADAAQLAEVVAESKLFAAQCQQNSAALLRYVGTRDAARDMDVLRAALGEPRLSYLGKSYGTYLGAWYAQLFPGRVRALVLDGAVDPGTPSLQADITQAGGFEVALRSFAAWCLARANCPLGHGGPVAGAVARVQALIERASAAPLANRLDDGQVADGALLLEGVAAALYSRPAWNDLRIGLANALAGDGTVLVEFANLLLERNPDGSYSNLTAADVAVNCRDWPSPRSLAAWQAAASAASRAAPLFGAPFVWGGLPCAYWPVPAYPQSRIRAPGAPPILVVGTLRDPATPYRWARALAGDLASGVLLGWNGDGHTAYGEGSACVDTIVNNYLFSLSVPRSGTVCSLCASDASPASGGQRRQQRHGFQRGMSTELSHQALHVGPDGVRRQMELFRNLVPARAVSHVREDLPLACGE